MTAALAEAEAGPEPVRAVAPLVRAAPRREPPFDDELDQSCAAGPLDSQLPFGTPYLPHPHRTAATTLPRELPDPAQWGHRLLVGIVESAGGRRPLQQLAAMLSASVASGLRAEFERAAREAGRHWTHSANVRSVHATEPVEGVAELSATVQAGRRVRAVAIRLESDRGRWRCTRLHLG